MYHIYFMCNSHTDPESHDFYFFCRSESIFFFFFGIGIYSRPVVIRFRMCTHNTHRHTYWKGIYTVGGPESYVHTSLTGTRKGKVHIRWVDLNRMYTHVLCWICENHMYTLWIISYAHTSLTVNLNHMYTHHSQIQHNTTRTPKTTLTDTGAGSLHDVLAYIIFACKTHTHKMYQSVRECDAT